MSQASLLVIAFITLAVKQGTYAPFVKAGVCPWLVGTSAPNSISTCNYDDDCKDAMKCCPTLIGRYCMMPDENARKCPDGSLAVRTLEMVEAQDLAAVLGWKYRPTLLQKTRTYAKLIAVAPLDESAVPHCWGTGVFCLRKGAIRDISNLWRKGNSNVYDLVKLFSLCQPKEFQAVQCAAFVFLMSEIIGAHQAVRKIK
uniref:WAP domain-containing protein n=1 Tax=Trichuris muris TaxID=70415 RepID=A0A5S6QQ56_TRIMR